MFNAQRCDYDKLSTRELIQWSCDKCKVFSTINENDRISDDMYDNFKTALVERYGTYIGHINCCGIRSKLTEIVLLLEACSFYILGITESHLNDKITDEEI